MYCMALLLFWLLWCIYVILNSVSHQRGLTQQLAASDQVSDGDVEVRVAAAPVGDLSEGVSGEDVLQETWQVRWAQIQCSTL